MAIVASKWLNQRQPPTGPQGAPVAALGVEAEVQTVGVANGFETIDLEALFPIAQYADWTGYACTIAAEIPVLITQVQILGTWSLIVYAPVDGTNPVPAGVTVRVRMLPPGTDLTP